MDCQKLTNSLARFGQMLPEIVRNIGSDQAHWKPPGGAWSIVEIVCHLGDEEEFDFRERVKRTLNDPNRDWPPIDPEGWAVERRYNETSLNEALARFVRLRQESVDWLKSLDAPDWTHTYQHPTFGPFRAGDIFASWVAHDCLHLRQISKRFYQWVNHEAGDFSTRYAGDW